jgi:hypothetical protein
LAGLVAALVGTSAVAQPAAAPRIEVVTDDQGSRLLVGGKPMMMRGMNWDYSPVGTNYSYSLWERP